MSACTFFGHRECYDLDAGVLRDAIESLILQGVDTFYAGNQGGFDRLVYGCLKRLKNIYPHIQVFVVLAHLPTEQREGEAFSDTLYPEIEGHPRFAIDRRNKWMIENADYCICYITHTWGGAYQYVQRASRQGLTVIYLGAEKPLKCY